MKISISLEAEIDFDIKVNNSILDEVARRYNGDFEAWALENYNDYFDIDDMEVFVEDCSFSKEEAKKLLENVREIIGSSEDDLTTVAINRSKLEQSKIDDVIDEKNLMQIKLDMESIKIAAAYCDFINPKKELNYIHMFCNIIEATDTRRLIKIYSNYSVSNEMYFPPYFIEPLEKDGICFVNSNNEILLKYNNQFYMGLRQNMNTKYPDTSRIEADINDRKFKKIPFSHINVSFVSVDELNEAVEIKYEKYRIYIQKMHWEQAIKQDVQSIGFKNAQEPFHLFGDGFEIVLMPLYIDGTTKIEYLK